MLIKCITVFLIILYVYSCTVSGAVIGSIADRKSRDYKYVYSLDSLKIGLNYEFNLGDDVVRGTLDSINYKAETLILSNTLGNLQVNFDQIQSFKSYTKSTKWRSTLILLGVAIDVALYLLFRSFSDWARGPN